MTTLPISLNLNEKILHVFKARGINIFHFVVVAPTLIYIGYLAETKQPITFGDIIIAVAISMGLFHLAIFLFSLYKAIY